jgi:hypothetical protein
MMKLATIICVMNLAMTHPLYAGDVIQVEKLSKAELLDALQKAQDDTVFEYRGQNKTAAQWRSEWLETHKPLDAEKLNEAAAAAKARFEADAKAFKDQQDKAIADETTKVDAEFEALKAR